MQRNLILEIEETKQELVYVVNKALKDKNLPCYLIEPILKDIYKEIYTSSQQELLTLVKQEQAQTEKEKTQEQPERIMEENNEN